MPYIVNKAIAILQAKFSSVEDFGPRQVVEFFDSPDAETQAMNARRAFELVQKFLSLIQSTNRSRLTMDCQNQASWF